MEFFQVAWNLVPSAFLITTPILLAATGGMICERAGVVNIALEGLMVLGAMTAAVTHFFLFQAGVGLSAPLALLFAAMVGGLFSLVHAFASVTLRADQVISGTGINLLSLGLTVFVCQLLFNMDRSQPHGGGMRAGLFGFFPTVWMALAILALAWFVMYKRPWGLRLRAAGEHPQALASAGVSVVKIRYMAVVISGLLAGLAGGSAVLTLDIQFTTTTINGMGFIALAAVSFGRWLPFGILGSSLLFGLARALAVYISNVRALSAILPSEFFSAMPFVITLVTLIIFSGKDYAPRAIGKPFDKGKS